MNEARRSFFRMQALAVAACLIPCTGTTEAAKRPRIEIAPKRALEGDPVSIRVTGLEPGAFATVHAFSNVRDDGGKPEPYSSEATFREGGGGVIDLATTAPVKGNYRGADVRGLFWSQRPLAADPAAQAAIAALRLDVQTALEPGQVELVLDVGGAVEGSETLTLASGDPGIVREDVRAAGLVGVFYHERRPQKRPVVVVLGGSEGGLDVADWAGPRLAARGFAVFGIDYFNPPGDAVAGVPTTLTSIPVELLEKARAWLRARPEADVARFGVLGYSKGAEFSLVLAATYPWVAAAVAYAPSDYVWQGIRYGAGAASSSWSRAGRDLPFLPSTGTREVIQKARESGGRVALAPVAIANIAAASPQALEAARIKLERSHAALLLIGGGDDRLWDSGASVDRIAAELKRAAFPHPHEILLYAGAGHELIGTGWRPTTADNTDFFQNGGTPEDDARAQADAWTRVLAFLRRQLRP